jgi:hypothetical protein
MNLFHIEIKFAKLWKLYKTLHPEQSKFVRLQDEIYYMLLERAKEDLTRPPPVVTATSVLFPNRHIMVKAHFYQEILTKYVKLNKPDRVKILLEDPNFSRYVHINNTDVSHNTVFYYVAHYLTELDNKDEENIGPLKEMISLLKKHGVSLAIDNAKGKTILDFINANKGKGGLDAEMVDDLVCYDRNRYEISRDFLGKISVVSELVSRDEIKKMIEQHPWLMTMRDRNGYTPLRLAIIHARTAIVELLMDSGADPLIPSNGGWTSLFLAAMEGHGPIFVKVARSNLVTSDDLKKLDIKSEYIDNIRRRIIEEKQSCRTHAGHPSSWAYRVTVERGGGRVSGFA